MEKGLAPSQMGFRPMKDHSPRGSALLLLVFVLSILITIPMAYRITATSRRETGDTLQLEQARDAARGGILDASKWFKRQLTQPVASLTDPVAYPYPDAAFRPDDTDPRVSPSGGSLEPAVGLVKEYCFSPEKKIWSRHEVRRAGAAGTEDPLVVRDISAITVPGAVAGQGLAWSIVSRGVIYQKLDPARRWNEPPNRVIKTAVARAEITWMDIRVPGPAALVMGAGSKATLNLFNAVDGAGAPAVIRGAGAVFTLNGGTAEGPLADDAGLTVNASGVFGVADEADIRSLADKVESGFVEDQFGNNIRSSYLSLDNQLLFIQGKGPGRSMVAVSGDGIVFVKGPVVLYGGLRGVVYVDGDVLLGNTTNPHDGGPFTLQGTMVLAPLAVVNVGLIPPYNKPNQNTIIYDSAAVQQAVDWNSHYRQRRFEFVEGVR